MKDPAQLDFDAPKVGRARLTPAEQLVAQQIRRGLSNREIARELGKSEATVKNQVSACLKKCSVRNRVSLIAALS